MAINLTGMKTYLIVLSVLLNIGLLFSFVRRKIYFATHKEDPMGWIDHYNAQKVTTFKALPLDSTNTVFVGTSLTEGFPMSDLLPSYGIKNRGIAGNYTHHILDRIEDIAKARPKKMFLEMSINDINAKVPEDTIFTHYVKTMEVVAKHRVPLYVQSVFPTTGEYKESNPVVVSLNRRLKDYCDKHHTQYIDVYDALVKDGELDSTLTYDGLHLNVTGYQVWKERVLPYLN